MRFKERISFLTIVTESDGAGGTTGAYETGYTCWANVKTDSLSRIDILQQTVNQVTVTIEMRYNSDYIPESGNQIAWRDRLLTIHGPVDLGEKNILKFKAAYDDGRRYNE